MTLRRLALPTFIAAVLPLFVFTATFGQDDDKLKPLKVFVLVGQSNMQGHAHVKTLEHIATDPQSSELAKHLFDESGNPIVSDQVWISYLSSQGSKSGKLTTGFGATPEKIGPELMFGIRVQKELNQPILIIKTAWGGKSINTDFRPPSAGPYEFSAAQLEQFKKQKKDIVKIKADKSKATGRYYRETIKHVQSVLGDIQSVYPAYNSKQGYELAGIVWFQGWNDMVDRSFYPSRDRSGGYDEYSRLLCHFIRDIRRDLNSPDVPFVIGVLGVNGPTSKYGPSQERYKAVHQNFRDAMEAPAKLSEFKDNVMAVRTENCWDQELTRLRRLQGELNQKVRELKRQKEMTREEERSVRDKLKQQLFTDEEWGTLEKAVSNAEYHYLGSAKILCRIGDSFAKTVLEMQSQEK